MAVVGVVVVVVVIVVVDGGSVVKHKRTMETNERDKINKHRHRAQSVNRDSQARSF